MVQVTAYGSRVDVYKAVDNGLGDVILWYPNGTCTLKDLSSADQALIRSSGIITLSASAQSRTSTSTTTSSGQANTAVVITDPWQQYVGPDHPGMRRVDFRNSQYQMWYRQSGAAQEWFVEGHGILNSSGEYKLGSPTTRATFPGDWNVGGQAASWTATFRLAVEPDESPVNGGANLDLLQIAKTLITQGPVSAAVEAGQQAGAIVKSVTGTNVGSNGTIGPIYNPIGALYTNLQAAARTLTDSAAHTAQMVATTTAEVAHTVVDSGAEIAGSAAGTAANAAARAAVGEEDGKWRVSILGVAVPVLALLAIMALLFLAVPIVVYLLVKKKETPVLYYERPATERRYRIW